MRATSFKMSKGKNCSDMVRRGYMQSSHEYDRILRNLVTMSSVKQNDKLLTEGEFFAVYTPTALRGLCRYWWKENRETNMMRIVEVVRSAKQFVTQCISEHEKSNDDTMSMSWRLHVQHDIQASTRLMKALAETVRGLENLKETYCDDVGTVSQLDTLKDEIVSFLTITNNVASCSPVIRRLEE